MPEPIRPTPTRPADTRPPSRPGGTPPPSGPTTPTLPRPGRHALTLVLWSLIVMVTAIVSLTLGLGAMGGAHRVAYAMHAPAATVPAGNHVGILSAALYVVLAVAFVVMTTAVAWVTPTARGRRTTNVRSVRAAVSRGRGRSSTSGLATVPVSGWPGAVAPPARPSAASPTGGRAGHIPPSPTWRSA